jgi:hypothetical protein
MAVFVLAACAQFKDMLALSSALQKQYGVQAMVKMTNSTHLTITFDQIPDAVEKAGDDSTARAQFAREAARFVKANYPGAAELEDVTIAFSHVRSLGVVTITHTEAPYTFAMRDIPSLPPASARR